MTDQKTSSSSSNDGQGQRRVTATIDLEATEVRDKTQGNTSKSFLQSLSRALVRFYRFLKSLHAEQIKRFATHCAAGVMGGILVFLFYTIASFFAGPSEADQHLTKQLSDRIDQLERLQIRAHQTDEKKQNDRKQIETLEAKLRTIEKSIATFAASGDLKNIPHANQAAAISNLISEVERNFDAKLENYRKQLDAKVEHHISTAAEGISTRLNEKIKSQDNTATAETTRLLLNNTTEELSRKITQLTKQSETLSTQITSLQDQNAQLQKKLAVVSMQSGQNERQLTGLTGEISDIRNHSLKQNDAENIVRPVSQRMSSLENRLLNIIQQEQKKQGDTRRAALTIALANLKRAIDRGNRFDSELETVRSLAPVVLPFPELDAYMEKGVRTISELERSFPSLLQATLEADQTAVEGSFWQRLTGNAASLVRIRRTGELEGQTTEAILARMEVRMKRGDLQAAVTEGKQLKGEAIKAAKAWLAEAQARLNLNEALMRVEMELLSELGTQTQSITPAQSDGDKTGSVKTEVQPHNQQQHQQQSADKAPTDKTTDGDKK